MRGRNRKTRRRGRKMVGRRRRNYRTPNPKRRMARRRTRLVGDRM